MKEEKTRTKRTIAIIIGICLIFEVMLFLSIGIFVGERNNDFRLISILPTEKKEIIVAVKKVNRIVAKKTVKEENVDYVGKIRSRFAVIIALIEKNVLISGKPGKYNAILMKDNGKWQDNAKVKRYVAEVKKKTHKKKKKEKKKEYKIPELSALKENITKELEDKEGIWSVYVKVLNNGESISINERYQRSASLIKLYVAGAYLDAVKNDRIESTSNDEENLRLMISESSNDAWMALETSLGRSYTSKRKSVSLRGKLLVENFIYDNGFKHTERDTGGSSMGNVTSVEDVGRVLEEIYDGKFVSKHASAKILEHMKNQTHRAKIPAGVPEKATVANKTGELENVENDAAIVWTDKCNYIMVVMSNKVNRTMQGVPEIKKLSSMVYEHLTGEKVSEEDEEEKSDKKDVDESRSKKK